MRSLVLLLIAAPCWAARTADRHAGHANATALVVRRRVEAAHGHSIALADKTVFKADLAKLATAVARKVTTTVSQNAEMASNVRLAGSTSGVVNGITVFVGQHGHYVLDFISWAGVAASGWLATDALAELIKINGTCMKVVQGARFLVSFGSAALGIASLTCMAGTDGGAIASFVNFASSNMWNIIQQGLEFWCHTGLLMDKMEVELPVTGEINSQERLNEAMSRQMGMNLGGCKQPPKSSKADVFLSPQEADERYKPKRKGFGQMLREDAGRPARCLRDHFYHISEHSSYEHLCGSSWS